MKRTLIIYQELGGGDALSYAIFDKDYSHLHGVAINSGVQPELEEEAISILYDEETGLLHGAFLHNDKSLLTDKNWDDVAIITFIM